MEKTLKMNNQKIHFDLYGCNVLISQETKDALMAHRMFCAAGKDWLIRNDSDCSLEESYLQTIKDCLMDDLDSSLANISEDEKEEILEEFSDKEISDWYEELASQIHPA
jgi:hypothetical protein